MNTLATWDDPKTYERGWLEGDVFDDKHMIVQLDARAWQHEEIVKHLRHLTALPKYKKDNKRLAVLPLTWAVITQIANLAERHGFKWRPSETLNAWILAEFTKRFDEWSGNAEDLAYDLRNQEREPMPHQASGAYLGAVNKRFFFADAAGTGKTMTALLTLAEMDARGLNPWPAFVVTPASVVDPWLEELGACFPDWTFTAYRGTSRKRLSSRYQVYVMSWHTFRDDMYPAPKAECRRCAIPQRIDWPARMQKVADAWALADEDKRKELTKPPTCPDCKDFYVPVDVEKTDLPPLLEFNVPRTVILDEAHALCNTKTKQSVAARRMARVAEYAFPMSGTPITNNVKGFWSALNVLDIASFPDQDRYTDQYTDKVKKNYGPELIEGLTTVNREEFYTLMQGSMRRVSKQDVLKDLPDKTYSTRVVTIPPAYRKAYDEMEEDMLAHVPDVIEPMQVMNTLAQLQRLSQLASSSCDVKIEMRLDDNPKSLTYGEEVAHYNITMIEPSWKVDELMEIMAESVGEPIITFSPHTQLMNLAGKRAESLGYRVGYIKGGQSHTARTRTRMAFQAGELDLLCANTSAGGVGLTLTAAHTAVFLERPWAFWQADQAEDRIHRRGQTGQVSIIDVVAANTVESRVRAALKDKATQLSDLIRDPHIIRNFLGGQKIYV